MCSYCGNQPGTEQHHLLKRSTHPELKDDPKNLVRLCHVCHRRTEEDAGFLKALQEIYYFWKSMNLDLYLRAEASIEALSYGKEIEYLTPAMADHYLQLACAKYNYLSERLAETEKLEPTFYLKRLNIAEETGEKLPMTRLKMEWRATENGQNAIEWKAKLKALEKMMSNLRARLHRFRTEYVNQK